MNIGSQGFEIELFTDGRPPADAGKDFATVSGATRPWQLPDWRALQRT
jgi:hypothetical protein